ncbi:hypothetical protein [uncultured Kordia sp.]|uniref:hypothetical protein n=1 Tax=uncultured Kordia sp. TaxID=507699 RepID=UPI002605C242|nr:hypothetical protein [uncultured Kordia sp.]
MKISSLAAFKQTGKHAIPQHKLHTISGGTETTSSSTSEEPVSDPIPPATTHTDPPPPKVTIYRIDGEFVYT